LPPGKNAGQAFVHDPKSIGSTSVKANLKLRFTAHGGKSMVIVRSMEVTQKKNTMTFKQLDGNLRTVNNTGERIAMSHKCTELDRQIPLMLGVSKAILENVVFCHQEDASWPLQEGAVLKKKFDDIFDSTRYTKALEVFSKAKKEYVLKAKDHKADVAELKSHRHAALGFRNELKTFNEQIEDLEDHLKAGQQALTENIQEKEKVQQKMDLVEDIDAKMGTKQNQKMTEVANVNTIRRMLKEDLSEQYDEKELYERLKTFDAQKESFEGQKQELEKQAREISQRIEEIRNLQTEQQSRLVVFKRVENHTQETCVYDTRRWLNLGKHMD
jgi:DNA repair protein RAD50